MITDWLVSALRAHTQSCSRVAAQGRFSSDRVGTRLDVEGAGREVRGDFAFLVGISRSEDVLVCQSDVAEEGELLSRRINISSVRRRDV